MEVMSQTLPGTSQENCENPQNDQCPGQDMNQTAPDFMQVGIVSASGTSSLYV